MTEIYLYTPRGYSPGYAYYKFSDALAQFLKDSEVKDLQELEDELKDYSVWYEFREDYIYVDDGGRIEKLELR